MGGTSRTPTGIDTGLSFVDILFALVAGKILDTLTRTDSITPVGWAHLSVAAVLMIMSWVGYHTSQARARDIRFFNLPLVQFLIDVALVVLYWMAVIFVEHTSPLAQDASALPQAVIIAIVFLLYAAWDVTSWRVAGGGTYGRRRVVSVIWLLVSMLLLALSAYTNSFHPHNATLIIGLACGSVVLLIGYRIHKVQKILI